MDEARLKEQKRRLPESSYMRLFENIWTPSEDRLTNLDDLKACVILDGPLEAQLGKRYVVGVDVGLKRDRTVVVVTHREEVVVNGQRTRRIILDRMKRGRVRGTEPVKLDEIETWIAQACSAYNRAKVIADPWQSVGMMQRLKAEGFKSTSSASPACRSDALRLLSTRHSAIGNSRFLTTRT